MSRFAFATLTPALLLLIACFVGGIWTVVALGYMTVFIAVLDWVIGHEETNHGKEFPASDWLATILGWLHFPILAVGIWALSGGAGLGFFEKLMIFGALGLFLGQISNSNAHELIHHSSRWKRSLGTWVYISMLYGHHASAHVRVHHVHVGSNNDPATARLGESFYNYARRAWIDGFRAGWDAEKSLNKRSKKARLSPYYLYVFGALTVVLYVGWATGVPGIIAFILLAAYAQTQLLMSDYVQHYGLQRKKLETGRLEPVGAHHSWNAPHVASSALMLNAPRHSDHHVNPQRRFEDLRLNGDMPLLPYALPVMATLALWPARWRKVMDPRVRRMAEEHADLRPFDPTKGGQNMRGLASQSA